MRIVDEEGVDALSMRRLGRELQVHGTSLYHYFADKDELVRDVILLAFEDLQAPASLTGSWKDFLIDSARRYRSVLLAHPRLLPVLLERHTVLLGPAKYEATIALLLDEGLALGAIMPMLNALEHLVLGSVISRQVDAALTLEQRAWQAQLPHLTQAVRAAESDDDATFDAACRAILDAFGAGAVVGRPGSAVEA